jgi:predicted acyl esterase
MRHFRRFRGKTRLVRLAGIASIPAIVIGTMSAGAAAKPNPGPAHEPSLAHHGVAIAAAPAALNEGGKNSGWPGGRWKPYAPMYGVTTVANVPIRMDDGVTLIADIEYPTVLATGQRAPGKFPVLLEQNPYFCDVPPGNANDFYVSRGYIFAAVCVRGAGRSGGSFGLYGAREQKDGAELAHWAAAIDGSDGKVGTYGCSYVGFNQFPAGGGTPDSPVKAMIPACASTQIYPAFMSGAGMPTLNVPGFLQNGSGILVGPRAAAFTKPVAANILSGGADAYDGAFWNERSFTRYLAPIVRSRIPVLLYSGWDDIYQGEPLADWAMLQNLAAGNDAPYPEPTPPGLRPSGRYQIVIGPWHHGQGLSPDLELEWYDTWLKGVNTGMGRTTTPIHMFDVTRGVWVNASRYPLTGSYTPYFLGSAGGLERRAPAQDGSESLQYAPGPSVAYTTKPFGSGGTLAGPVDATLYASSTSTNLELVATLQDIAPDGTATRLAAGAVVGSLRQTDTQRDWRDENGLMIQPHCACTADSYLSPGMVYRFDIALKPVAATIMPGHELRLVITSQDTADCAPSSARPDTPCIPTAPQSLTLPGTYTIMHGPQAPSAVNLPILPLGYFTAAGSGPIPTNWG